MKSFKLFIATSLISLSFWSCQKDRFSIEEGIYSGTLTRTYSLSAEKLTWSTVIKLESGKYVCTSNAYSVFHPVGGSGNFSITGNKITFKDENNWPDIGDHGLILNGEYYYTFIGKRLVISSKKGDGLCQYDLKRE